MGWVLLGVRYCLMVLESVVLVWILGHLVLVWVLGGLFLWSGSDICQDLRELSVGLYLDLRGFGFGLGL